MAFPAISTGIFGYPVEEAARVALGTVVEAAERLESVRLIRFVLFGEKDLEVHEGSSRRRKDGKAGASKPRPRGNSP